MIKKLLDDLVNWFRSLFWKQEMELTLVGLQNSGKTTLVNVLAVSIVNRCLFSSVIVIGIGVIITLLFL